MEAMVYGELGEDDWSVVWKCFEDKGWSEGGETIISSSASISNFGLFLVPVAAAVEH